MSVKLYQTGWVAWFGERQPENGGNAVSGCRKAKNIGQPENNVLHVSGCLKAMKSHDLITLQRID